MPVPGIDVMFIGPHDLSGTVGQLGNLKHPRVAALIERAEKAILAQRHPDGHGAASGLHCVAMFERGYSFVNAGSDVGRLRDSSLADVRASARCTGGNWKAGGAAPGPRKGGTSPRPHDGVPARKDLRPFALADTCLKGIIPKPGAITGSKGGMGFSPST